MNQPIKKAFYIFLGMQVLGFGIFGILVWYVQLQMGVASTYSRDPIHLLNIVASLLIAATTPLGAGALAFGSIGTFFKRKSLGGNLNRIARS